MEDRERDVSGYALNEILAIAIGAANAVVDVLLLPALILSFFVAELTPSYVTIGLVPAVGICLWTLARLPATLLASTRRRLRPWAFGASVVRVGAIAVLAILASRTSPDNLSQSGRPLLIAFFLCFIVFSLAGGFAAIPTAVVVESSIGVLRRGRIQRVRAVVSGLLAVLGALMITRLLGPNSLEFPGNYGRLFLVAVVCLIAIAVFTATLREVPHSRRLVSALPSVRSVFQAIVDPRLWRYVVVRFLLTTGAALDPFLFLFAVTRLGISISTIGQCALAGVLGWVIASPIWTWLLARNGPKTLLQGASVLRLVAPIVALILPQLNSLPIRGGPSSTQSALQLSILIAFAAIGASLSAQYIAHPNYITRLASPVQTGTVSGIVLSAIVLAGFAPVLGGVIIQRFGYEILFALAVIVGLCAVFASGTLVGTPRREAVRSPDPERQQVDFPALPAPHP